MTLIYEVGNKQSNQPEIINVFGIVSYIKNPKVKNNMPWGTV